jgi:hypothetical protein
MCGFYIFQINSLPTLGIYNDLPQSGLTKEVINILKNLGLNPPLSNSSPFSKTNPSSNTPPASPSTLLPFTNYNPPPQLPPLSPNPTDSNSDYLVTPSISTPDSESAPLPSTASNQQSNLDLLLNFNRNAQNSLVSGLSQKTVPNSYSNPTELLQSFLRPPIIDTLPTKTNPAIASPLDPSSAPSPNLPQSLSPSSKLVSLEPMTLSSKMNEEILKLLSGSPPTPQQEPIKTSNPDSIPNPDSPSIIPPSSIDLPSTSTDSLPPPPPTPLPPPPPPTPPSTPPTPDALIANQLLNILVTSPNVMKEMTSILQNVSAQNSNSKPSLTDAN